MFTKKLLPFCSPKIKYIPIPEIVFYAFCGWNLKVAMGKGLTDWETIGTLLEIYAGFLGELDFEG